ncbi:MAG: FkbM family methyltransferase [Promethearchaeota archaeon]
MRGSFPACWIWFVVNWSFRDLRPCRKKSQHFLYNQLVISMLVKRTRDVLMAMIFILLKSMQEGKRIHGKNEMERRSVLNGKMTRNDGDYSVSIVSIDDFVKSKNLDVGLIELDVEGEALSVIKGSKETIVKFKPILLIAVYHSGEEFFEIKDFVKNLVEGYKFTIRKLSGRAFADTTLIAYFNK